MNVTSRQIMPVLLAVLLLVFVGIQTSDALKSAAPWPGQRNAAARGPRADPYARLESLIAASASASAPSTMRDPFSYGNVAVVVVPSTHPVVRRPVIPPPPPMPVVTAVVTDADPQAVIIYLGVNYTVRVGHLFADFQVISISAEQVVLDRGGERVVLRVPLKGE